MAEILESFAAESAEHLAKASDFILRIEKDQDAEAINGLFRSFHTIKGNARMLGFQRIGELAHSAESAMARLRSGEIRADKQLLDLLLAAVDAIAVMLEEEGSEKAPSASAERLRLALETFGADRGESDGKGTAEERKGPPAPKKEAKPRPPAATRDAARDAPQTRRGNASILVVEDDFLSRKTLTGLLKRYGTCDVAIDGEEAVEAFTRALEDRPYDLVCLDIMMPKVDGFEAARRMRAAETLAASRRLKEATEARSGYVKESAVVVMTSSLEDPEHIVNACYRCGADAYLVKPISADTLRGILRRFALD
jgi:two-component system chemotaxis response regulator CheY